MASSTSARGSVKLLYGLQTVVAGARAEALEARAHQGLHPAGGRDRLDLRGHFGPDFSKYDLDEHVQNIEIPGIRGCSTR